MSLLELTTPVFFTAIFIDTWRMTIEFPSENSFRL